MGLEDFKSEDEYEIGSISTRKKIKNVKLSEDAWHDILAHEPHWADFFAHDLDQKSIKAIVETMDDLIENGSEHFNMSEDMRDDIKHTRNRIVEEHIKGD